MTNPTPSPVKGEGLRELVRGFSPRALIELQGLVLKVVEANLLLSNRAESDSKSREREA